LISGAAAADCGCRLRPEQQRPTPQREAAIADERMHERGGDQEHRILQPRPGLVKTQPFGRCVQVATASTPYALVEV